MNTKKFLTVVFVMLIFVLTVFLTGCGRGEVAFEEPLPSFSELIGSGNFDDVSLTIYYKNFLVLTRIPVSLELLTGGWYDYRIVVGGEELAEHRELLNRLSNVEPAWAEPEAIVNARLYYVFEHEKYGEIFSFVAHGFHRDSSNIVVFVNGREAKDDRIFYEAVLPFLPETAVGTIQTVINATWPAMCE